MRKRISAFLCILLVTLCFCGFDFATEIKQGIYVYDDGDYLTSSQESEVQSTIVEAMKNVKSDILVVFTENPSTSNERRAAEIIAEQWVKAGYGYGENHNTIVFYVDMINRNFFIDEYSTDNKHVLTDSDIDNIIDGDLGGHMSNGNYLAASKDFVEGVVSGAKPGFFGTIWGWLIVGCIGGAIATFVVFQVHTRPKTISKRHYLSGGHLEVDGRQDIFVNTTTVTRHIETSSGGSGGGHSSSGSSGHHGGGGHF